MHLLSIYVLAVLLVAQLGLISVTVILMHVTVSMRRFGLWLANGRSNDALQAETEIQGLNMLSSVLRVIAILFGVSCLGAVGDVFICFNVSKDVNMIMLPIVSMVFTAILAILAMIIGFTSIEEFKGLYRDFSASWILIGTIRRSYAAGEPEVTEAMIKAQRKSLRNKRSELFVVNNKTKRCEVPKRRILR